MANYIVRPSAWASGNTYVTTNAASNADMTTKLSDNSDATSVQHNSGSATTYRFTLGAPSIPTDEFIARISSSIRWSGGGYTGSGSTMIGCSVYVTGSSPSIPGSITTDGRGSASTTEIGPVASSMLRATASTLSLGWYDGRNSNLAIATTYDLWATLYTIKNATSSVSNQTSTQSFPSITTTVTATIDWEVGTLDAQNLRKVRTFVQIESGGSGFNTGTVVGNGFTDTLFTATGSQTVVVPTTTAIANGTYNVYVYSVRFREDGSTSVETIGAVGTVATLTQNVSSPAMPALSSSWDATNQRVVLTSIQNLISNSGFETNTTGWTAGANTTIARVTTPTYLGSAGSLSLTATASGNVLAQTPSGVSGIPVTAGTAYSLSFYMNPPGTTGFTSAIDWYNSAGTFLSTSTQSSGPISSGFWTRVALNNATAPAGATFARLNVQMGTINAAAIGYIDAVQFEASSSPTTYVAGGTSYANPVTYQLQESTDGITYTNTRSYSAYNATAANVVPAGAIAYDYEADRNKTNYYRLRANSIVSSITYSSAWNTTTIIPTFANQWNIKVPENSALNFLDASVIGDPVETIQEDLGVFKAVDRQYPIIVAGTIGGWDGELNMVTINSSEWNKFKAIAEAQKVLYLESPFGWSKYIRLIPPMKLNLLGSATAPRRNISVAYVEVTSP